MFVIQHANYMIFDQQQRTILGQRLRRQVREIVVPTTTTTSNTISNTYGRQSTGRNIVNGPHTATSNMDSTFGTFYTCSAPVFLAFPRVSIYNCFTLISFRLCFLSFLIIHYYFLSSLFLPLLFSFLVLFFLRLGSSSDAVRI